MEYKLKLENIHISTISLVLKDSEFSKVYNIITNSKDIKPLIWDVAIDLKSKNISFKCEIPAIDYIITKLKKCIGDEDE